MEDFRMKLQSATKELSEKVSKGEELSPDEIKILFLNSFLSEENNEQ